MGICFDLLMLVCVVSGYCLWFAGGLLGFCVWCLMFVLCVGFALGANLVVVGGLCGAGAEWVCVFFVVCSWCCVCCVVVGHVVWFFWWCYCVVVF